MNTVDFLAKIVGYAVSTMHATDIPASLTIAQAILESGWGESELTKRGNNLFGIKGTGSAGSGIYPTKEYVNGNWITIQAQFRHYNNWGESIADHSRLLLNGTRDQPNRYHGVLGADYRTAAKAIYAGGYATDKNYPQLLIQLIEQYKLYEYDREEDDQLKLNDYQQKMLVDALTTLNKQGVITDPSWVDKANKGTLTLSELTWLNTIILSRRLN